MRSALIPILCLPRLFLLPKSVIAALCLGVLSSASLWGRDINFTPDKPDGPAKIQSALWELATPGAGKRVCGLQDTVVVILVPHLGQASASIDTASLAALGGRVLAQSKSLMRVSVPASSLVAVSELPGVRFVRRPYRPHAQQTWSEGGRLINAYDSYFEGVRGQGVKVAVIDSGFKGMEEVDGPPRWWYYDYTGEGIYVGDSVHGTACAEIIHDVAPEAEFYIYKVGDLLDLENATERAVRDSIDVISHSMSWLGTGIGDGKGTACDIVNDAADNGILWVNSAGNSAKSHYYQPWSDSDDDGWHNFAGEDETLGFEAEKGTETSVYLTWNDWPETRDDYDLYLYFSNSSGDLERVAESTNVQRRDSPVEWIEYEAERSGEYHVVVYKSEEARSRRLKIWSLNRNLDFEYSSPERSIGIPADAVGAMSVGAVDHIFYGLGWIEDYSSRGPTLDGRIKPDLVAPTGVSTVSYAPDSYHGTSAAAPHVAGAAALIKSAYPSYSRTQLWDALVDATVDIGALGRDNDSGYGKLVLPVLLKQLPSTGLFGYSPPAVTENPKSVKFGFEGNGNPGLMGWELKNNAEVDILINGKHYGWASESDDYDWQTWFTLLSEEEINSGQNVIEFRNQANQNRTVSFSYWELKDVFFVPLNARELRKYISAKAIAGAKFLGPSGAIVESGLGDPFPSPFNAEVTIPFALAEGGPVRLAVYNLLGQQVRVLADGWLVAGAHRVHWDGHTTAGAEAASGVYWAVLQAGEAVQTAKLALIR
ncbi:MAG: S8 family serine peptidase [Gemmatimonadetes bacterium]|nr:S8 family serine peptidase [Gemmatimonadota bacterium]